MTTKRLDGRLALITGASRGIGASVAQAYAAEGCHVILLARTQGALEEVDDLIQQSGGKATLLPFDLSETKKIEALGEAIASRFGKLDILVGNAGVLGPLSPVAHSDPRQFDQVFKVNFQANYHLIRTFDPLLRASSAGRALFVTSGAAAKASPFFGAYAASKAALERMVAAYAAETAYSTLKVNIVDPGIVRTEMRAEAFPAEDPAQLPSPVSVVEMFIQLALPSLGFTGQIVPVTDDRLKGAA